MSDQEVYRAIMQHHDWLAGAGYPVQRRANGRLDPWAEQEQAQQPVASIAQDDR